MRLSAILFVGVGLASAGASAAPQRYTLDTRASQVVIDVGKTGVLGFAGHEHEVVTGTMRGTATIDPDQLAGSSLEVTFDAAALRVTGKGEPAKDVPEVQATMLGPKCLDAARFPAIRFVSRAANEGPRIAGERDLVIRGDLTLHGVTRELSIPVRLTLTADSFVATGATMLNQTDFGITPVAVGGVVKVKNELALRWRLVGRVAAR